jgi:hypothetical protein
MIRRPEAPKKPFAEMSADERMELSPDELAAMADEAEKAADAAIPSLEQLQQDVAMLKDEVAKAEKALEYDQGDMYGQGARLIIDANAVKFAELGKRLARSEILAGAGGDAEKRREMARLLDEAEAAQERYQEALGKFFLKQWREKGKGADETAFWKDPEGAELLARNKEAGRALGEAGVEKPWVFQNAVRDVHDYKRRVADEALQVLRPEETPRPRPQAEDEGMQVEAPKKGIWRMVKGWFGRKE